MPPIIRIRLSPTTTHAERRALLTDAGEVRDGEEAGLTNVPTISERDEHRQQRQRRATNASRGAVGAVAAFGRG